MNPEKARRLSALLDAIAAAARRARPFARFVTLLALFAAIALTLEARHFANLGNAWTGALLALLLVPALVLAWLWWLLADLADLPQQARNVLGGLREVALGPEPAAAPPRGVFGMGGSLREAMSLALDAGSLAGAIASVMILANPLFLLVLGASMIGAFGLALVAAVAGCFLL